MTTVKISALTTLGAIDRAADFLAIVDTSLVTTFKVTPNNMLGITGAPLGDTDTQTISNKTLGNTNVFTIRRDRFTLQDSADTTKQANFILSGITTATTRSYTLPNASVTLASLTGTETLTNKTITSPAITGGTLANATITVDSIAGFSSATVVTVAGVQLNNGTIGTANAVTTASIADTAVTPAKLQSGTGTGWSWQSYTPTFTNLTVGNGTLTCAYCQIGKLVIVRISFQLGTTSAVGTTPTLTLPVTSVASYVAGHWLGGIRIVAGAAGFTGYIQWASTTTALLLALNASATYVSDTSANFTAAIPGVWTTSDSFRGTIMYEAA